MATHMQDEFDSIYISTSDQPTDDYHSETVNLDDENNSEIHSADEENYYSILNISQQADSQEIRHAFRKCSLIYHPDKFTDPDKKHTAQIIFKQITEAYEVLRDSYKRSIYDLHGKKGLESDHSIIPRDSSICKHEIFLKLRDEIEELKSFKTFGNFSASLNLTDIMKIQRDNGIDFNMANRVFMLRDISITQGFQTQLSKRTMLTIQGTMNTNRDAQQGALSLALSHQYSSSLSLQSKVSLGSWPTFIIDIKKRISDRFRFDIYAICRIMAPYATVAVIPSIFAKLDDKSNVKIEMRLGVNTAGINYILTRQFTDGFSVGIHFKMSLSDPCAKIKLAYEPFKSCTTFCTLSYGLFLARFKYSIFQTVTPNYSLGVSFMISRPGGVGIKFHFKRYMQTFSMPITFSDRISIQSLIYSHLLPAAIYGIYYVLSCSTFVKSFFEQTDRPEHIISEQLEKQRLYLDTISLLKEAYTRNKEYEQALNGLIIKEAYYGLLKPKPDVIEELVNQGLPYVLDVTVILQTLVKDSILCLSNTSKSRLRGFYDIYKGEKKELLVRYVFNQRHHEVLIGDCEPLGLPKVSHQLRK